MPALFFGPILIKDAGARLADWRGRPDYAKCAEIDLDATLEGMHLRLPINPMLDLTAETPGVREGDAEGVTSYRLDSERSARMFCADRHPLALRSIGISTSKYYTDAGEKWLNDSCDEPANSIVGRMCRMRRLGDVGGGSAGFTLQKMNASAKQQPTYQEMLRKNHFESEDVYLSDEDGYRVLTYHSSGGFVGVAEQVTALDGGPLMFTCNFPLDVLVCDVIEQLPPTISRDISVHAQDGFIGRQVKVARELADDLLAAMRSNSTP